MKKEINNNKKKKKNETVTFVFLQVFPINSIFTFRETHTRVALQKSLEVLLHLGATVIKDG